MADGDPGLLDDLWGGWKEWWRPTSVPAGAAYGPEDLGSARAETLGALGGRLLALSQGGLQPAQRAAILGSLGEVPQVYQNALGAGVEARMHAAALHKTEAELANEAAANEQLDRLIAGQTAGGAPTSPSGNLPAGGAIQTALAALAPAESGGNAGAQNAQGYSGKFQIGSSLASDAGVYKPAPGESVADERGRATNQWRGTWVLPGMAPMTHEQFRANPAAQQAAAEAAMAHNWSQIQAAGLDKYVGHEVGGVNITAAGLLQGAWLGGIKGLQTWLSGGGDPADSNKTTVSKWASLQPPGGARTMTDAGGGGDSEAPGGGGSSALPVSPRPRSVADLTPEQLVLLRQLPAKERPAKILEMTGKPETSIVLTPAQSARFGPGSFQYNPTTGVVTKIADAQTVDIPKSDNAKYGYGPDAVLQRDANGNVKLVRDSSFRNLTADELKAEGYNPNAIVQAGPDNKRIVVDKGTDPDAPLTLDSARGILIKHAPAVEAGTLDPNSADGRRYRAAHDLLSQQGQWVDVKQPDGSIVRTFQQVPVNHPVLGTPGAAQPSLRTAPPTADTQRTPQQLFSDANQVRSEIERGPVYINYSNSRPALLSLRQAEPVGTGASDRQMIIAFAKILDPNSVVMTSEGEAVQKTGGIFDTLQGMISHIQGGGTLSPSVRRNLVEQGESVFNAHETAMKDRVDTYRDLAKRGGLDPDSVYPAVTSISRYTPPGQPMKLPGNETIDSYADKLNAYTAKGQGTYEEALAIAKRYGIPPEKIKRK
jgi:hypothetical protein